MEFGRSSNEDPQLAYEDLLDEGLINPESDEAGVARQVINQGFESMTSKQKHIYESRFETVLTQRAKQLETQRIIDSALE